MHSLVRRHANREMYLVTHFLRNRPALELFRRLAASERFSASQLRIAVLGCSIGVEVYSIVWTLRRDGCDLQLVLNAVDISADAIRIGERGVYGPEASRIANWPIFDGLNEAERAGIFEWNAERQRPTMAA